jgi:hypothetical protein
MRVTKNIICPEMREMQCVSARRVLLPCRRCGGFLVEDHCLVLDTREGRAAPWAMRCVQCGDMIDETILRNRYASHILPQADPPLKKVTKFKRIAEEMNSRAA